jgi:hypothetical protein
MGMIGLLVALYPRKWREEFGEEFAALLEEARLTPRAVVDVVVQAAKLHAESHRRPTAVLASLLWSGCLEYLSVRAGLTANILWAPTTPARALALAATTGPWLALAAVTIAGRRGGRDGAAGGTAP